MSVHDYAFINFGLFLNHIQVEMFNFLRCFRGHCIKEREKRKRERHKWERDRERGLQK